MQRSTHNTMPPRQSANAQNAQQNSPALAMAKRIRSEQGTERAREYLSAMEPFVAPAERLHIADQLGIQLPSREIPNAQPNSQYNNGYTPQQSAPMGGMNNPMQMLQMLSSLGGMGGGAGKGGGLGGMDPMMLMQLMGALGKK